MQINNICLFFYFFFVYLFFGYFRLSFFHGKVNNRSHAIPCSKENDIFSLWTFALINPKIEIPLKLEESNKNKKKMFGKSQFFVARSLGKQSGRYFSLFFACLFPCGFVAFKNTNINRVIALILSKKKDYLFIAFGFLFSAFFSFFPFCTSFSVNCEEWTMWRYCTEWKPKFVVRCVNAVNDKSSSSFVLFSFSHCLVVQWSFDSIHPIFTVCG